MDEQNAVPDEKKPAHIVICEMLGEVECTSDLLLLAEVAARMKMPDGEAVNMVLEALEAAGDRVCGQFNSDFELLFAEVAGLPGPEEEEEEAEYTEVETGEPAEETAAAGDTDPGAERTGD
ncbi:MAG: hypothetical protein PHR51_02615 [Patescibacteria group bacterium]|nr:hypothetical protein [Patescibacteria group bacterium]